MDVFLQVFNSFWDCLFLPIVTACFRTKPRSLWTAEDSGLTECSCHCNVTATIRTGSSSKRVAASLVPYPTYTSLQLRNFPWDVVKEAFLVFWLAFFFFNVFVKEAIFTTDPKNFFNFTELSVIEMCFNRVPVDRLFPLLKRIGRSMSHFHSYSQKRWSWLKLPCTPCSSWRKAVSPFNSEVPEAPSYGVDKKWSGSSDCKIHDLHNCILVYFCPSKSQEEKSDPKPPV